MLNQGGKVGRLFTSELKQLSDALQVFTGNNGRCFRKIQAIQETLTDSINHFSDITNHDTLIRRMCRS